MSQTFQALMVNIPVQHKLALERLKQQTGVPLAALVEKAIELLSQQMKPGNPTWGNAAANIAQPAVALQQLPSAIANTGQTTGPTVTATPVMAPVQVGVDPIV